MTGRGEGLMNRYLPRSAVSLILGAALCFCALFGTAETERKSRDGLFREIERI